MSLTAEDARLFFKLYFSILAYTNRKFMVIENVTSSEAVIKISHEQLLKIRNALYTKPETVTQLVLENPDKLPQVELSVVSGWRHFIAGDFFILKYLKKYTVFLSAEGKPRLFGVFGLTDPIQKVMWSRLLLTIIKIVLLPFNGQIIYDGLVQTYHVSFGVGIRGDLNETYRRLKAKEGIVERLLGTDSQPPLVTSLTQKPTTPAPDWRPAVDDIVALAEKMRKADTPAQTTALSLLRAAANLALVTLNQTGEYEKFMKSIRRALTKLEYELDMDEFGHE